MVYKIKKRLLLSNLILLFLFYLILVENPSYSNLVDSILGNIEFYSFFDRAKFFLPITLLLSITSDYLSFILEKNFCTITTRFNSRKKLSISIFKGLYFCVFMFWSIIMFLSVILSIYFKNNITDILSVNLLITFITGYFFYSMIVVIQMLFSMFLGTNKSFIIVVAIAIMSTLVTNNLIKYLLIVPIGMGLNKTSLAVDVVRTILVIIITIISSMIIYKKIERFDIGVY
ncbi:DUF2705 family protein [Anaerosalibacter massiliensis]|uniref:DUF2705 family protein n=2 Tax=Anaerosalibacter massiliensis TaxID=1347392 RepID=UPI0005B2527C|nr:DUF2705 family protein [Anaerosalibacter massiliensis]